MRKRTGTRMSLQPSVGICRASFLALLALSACSVRITDARSSDELEAEGEYASAYQRAVEPLVSDFQEYMPSVESPGVCNVGSPPEACLEMNRIFLSDLESAKSVLAQVIVPRRHAEGNRLLLSGMDQLREGLERMNDVLEQQRGSFGSSSKIVKQAVETLAAAWEAFPQDAKPLPQL